MKQKHHRGQRHYSGKELLERRKAEREEHEKRLAEVEQRKEDEDPFGFSLSYYYPAKLLYGGFKVSVF